MSDSKKLPDAATIEKLEASKKAVLKRIAENLKSQEGNLSTSHYSHSSGSGRTHSSVIN
jgi:hypothetical protein